MTQCYRCLKYSSGTPPKELGICEEAMIQTLQMCWIHGIMDLSCKAATVLHASGFKGLETYSLSSETTLFASPAYVHCNTGW